MSLFPAYATNEEGKEENAEFNFQASSKDFPKEILKLNQATDETVSISDDDSSVNSDADDDDKVPRQQQQIVLPPLEFHGDEQYFVDKKGEPGYKKVQKLYRPACPRYYHCKITWHSSASRKNSRNQKKVKRYYQKIRALKSDEKPLEILNENDFISEQGLINAAINRDTGCIDNWLNLLDLQGKNPYKWSRLFLAEKKLEILQRAFQYHPQNDLLYRKFIEIINATYPPFEVSQKLDGLLFKDSQSYTLWTAQIMATQGSMARCIVSDVLKIYERCMSKMHHKGKHGDEDMDRESSSSVHPNKNADIIMLKLFNNCAQFLRATGLYEQFFALVKLSLELNVSVDKFSSLVHDGDKNNTKTLIEYEELILQSGLPMNEIWLRIERLRQGFNFLPQTNAQNCTDPQSIVFNEDVCHYVYPLKDRNNSFQLMLIILRQCKVPLISCEGLAAKFSEGLEAIGDSDAVEDVLGVCIRNINILPLEQHKVFVSYLSDFVKELVVTPTFLSNCIGHEIYTRTISQLILNCSETQTENERRRNVFLVLWCRFQRILLFLEHINGKLTKEFLKAGRNKFKNLLKQDCNRNSILLYIEFALFEYETLDSDGPLDTVQNIFNTIIANKNVAEDLLCYGHVIYAEILIARKKHDEAVQVLVKYILGHEADSKKVNTSATLLSALKKIQNSLCDKLREECENNTMNLEDYFLPDLIVCQQKLCAYLQYLAGQKSLALESLEKNLRYFGRSSDRHKFLRERFFELYIAMSQLPEIATECLVMQPKYKEKLFSSLEEFPRNMFLLQQCAMLSSAPWYQIRSAMFNKNRNILSLIYTVIAIRYRLSKDKPTDAYFDEELTLRNRILNIFETIFQESYNSSCRLEENNLLKRNALFWRFYLRCLSDQRTDFEVSKKCLFTALDECPWSKALYIDGATKVPQEFAHLQDLLIEKQLRVYALPEELEILREQRIS